MPTKVLRLQIHKPFNKDNDQNLLTWDELDNTLREIRYQSAKIANFVIQKSYEWEMFCTEYKKQNGRYPSRKDYKEKSYLYPLIRQTFPNVSSKIANQIRQLAEKHWQHHRNEVLSFHESIPSFRLDLPIAVAADGYSIVKKTNCFVVSVCLRAEGSPRSRYQFAVKTGEKPKRMILERVIEGVYRKGALQIVSDRWGKWYCLIPYKFEDVISREPDVDQIMGVCLGIKCAIHWSFSNSQEHGKIEGEEVRAFWRRVYERRKSIERQGNHCGQGRIGHGCKRRLKPVEALESRERNFKNTINHTYARKVVEEALKHRCGTIQIENLEKVNRNSVLLKHWQYFDLQQKIIDKAGEYGIRVIIIDSEHIFRKCSWCGDVDEENSIVKQDSFICNKCGYGGFYQCSDCSRSQREAGVCLECGTKMKLIKVSVDCNASQNMARP